MQPQFKPIGQPSDFPLINGPVYAFSLKTGEPLWPGPALVRNRGIVLQQPQDIPLLVFADRQMIRDATSGGGSQLRVLCLDRRTGQTVYRNDALPDTSVTRFRVRGETDSRPVVALEMSAGKILLAMTDRPRPPQPPANDDLEAPREIVERGLRGLGQRMGSALRGALERPVPIPNQQQRQPQPNRNHPIKPQAKARPRLPQNKAPDTDDDELAFTVAEVARLQTVNEASNSCDFATMTITSSQNGLHCLCVSALLPALTSRAAVDDPRTRKVITEGLDYLAYNQHKLGHWTAQGRYPTAMTALAGIAFLSEGSTTTQGKYAENIRRAVDYILRQSRPNGLIGDPVRDDRYTYGHGFSMLFLSQVLGDEEDEDRRAELVDVLTRAVQFTGQAQTQAGGWGYVSAKDGGGFDEGSTTITQVQGLRSCRNAGIPVPKEIIDKAVQYIKDCTLPEGGVQYSSKGGGGRPAITAAAIACLFNAGQYDDDLVPRMMKYCEQNLDLR